MNNYTWHHHLFYGVAARMVNIVWRLSVSFSMPTFETKRKSDSFIVNRWTFNETQIRNRIAFRNRAPGYEYFPRITINDTER